MIERVTGPKCYLCTHEQYSGQPIQWGVQTALVKKLWVLLGPQCEHACQRSMRLLEKQCCVCLDKGKNERCAVCST